MTPPLQGFDKDMLRVMRYHNQLVKLCRQLTMLHIDGDAFDTLTRGEFKREQDNMKIRWALEDRIRALLKKHGDFGVQVGSARTEGR